MIIAAVAAPAAQGQARDEARPLDAYSLVGNKDGENLTYPLEIFMDGASYSWRIHLPREAEYESYLVAIRQGEGIWKVLDGKGRIRSGTKSESLFSALASSAANKSYPSSYSGLEEAQAEGSACYFPGWTTKSFQLGAAPSNGEEELIPLERSRMVEQILPSPSLIDPSGEVTAVVALKRKDSAAVDGLVITTEAEYIAGEREFFTKPAYVSVSYTKKALALMGSTFGTESGYLEYRQAALAANPGIAMSDSDWNMFTGDVDLQKMQHRLLTHFLNTTLSATENKDDIKVLKGSDSPSWFETLYGVNRIPYVSSYLEYAWEAEQPLLVSPIEETYSSYDYTKYSTITIAEGKELARAAMRYYTWGVDYFIPEKGDSKPIFGPAVYDANKASIAAWTTTANTARAANYYPGTVSSLDIATIPGTKGLPTGWASALGLDSPYANGQAGSPLPYARGKAQSPRDFAKTMIAASTTTRGMKYTLPPAGTGVDSLGLVTGALAQTGLYTRIENLPGAKPASSLDAFYKAGTTPTGTFKLTRSDLEKASLLVPNLTEAQVGDLVVHYGMAEGQSRDSFRAGIVVYAPSTGLPAWGIDPSEYLKQVVIVGANEGDRQVSLMTWISNGTTKGFTEDGSGASLRRFVASAAPVQVRTMMARAMAKAAINQEADGLAKKRTALNATIKDIKFTYSESYDCDSLPAAGRRQRWIPNTGEYMVISGLRLEKAVNLEGAVRDLQRDAGDKYTINVTAIDRGYDADKAGNGNIYNNTEKSEFELIGIWNLWIFGKNINIGHLTLDAMQYADQGNAIQRKHYSYQAGNTPQGFRLDANGAIQYHGSILTYDKIGIRPASHCNPGDDILLCLDMYDSKGNLLIRKPMEEKEYFAVYDKKMLWRANLYIKEDANDWNDVYPWNAPPASGVAASGGNPSWWSESWGYNEWNRRMKITPEFIAGKSVGLANLPAGNGNQVVEFAVFTPLRTLPNGRAANTSNSLGGAVAYSYPLHDFEPSDGNLGYSGSQDSPFDFLWKMLNQKRSLSTVYDANGITKTQQSTTSWTGTKAPNNSWKNYSPGTSTTPGYIPNLGLWYWDPENGNNEADVANLPWKSANTYEAGTDCLGFAQRAGSWMFGPGKTNPYAWKKLIPGMMEYSDTQQGTVNPKDVYTTSAADRRQFPDEIDYSTSIVQNGYPDKALFFDTSVGAIAGYTQDQKSRLLDALRRVVPGDIWVKKSPTSEYWKAHIAIIAKLPDDSYSITDPVIYMSQMILIEAEYVSKVQSVIKKLSVGDYNSGNIPVGRQIYDNYTVPDQDPSTPSTLDPISLRCQSWAIRRLK
jgi:hypothetical protein